MLGMVRAHGLDPGPTQRPLAAGALAGLLAALPTVAVLEEFAWLGSLSELTDSSHVAVGVGCVAVLGLAGVGYGLAFRRAANDPVGGWLFGLAFGFLLWMLVPVALLQWLPEWSQGGRPAFIGRPAMGLLVGALVWGSALGALFPLVHRRLRAGIDSGEAPREARLGPEAAAVPDVLTHPSPAEVGQGSGAG